MASNSTKLYCYNEPIDEEAKESRVVKLTRQEILDFYWDYWKKEMDKAGKSDMISEDLCIQDFVTVNWAWEENNESN